jgi:cytidine deaminase
MGAKGEPLQRHAFILHSLKHPNEIRTLREVYGDAFVAISVYTPKSIRRSKLAERITHSHQRYNSADFVDRADELIERDEKAVGEDLGQNVRDTFPEADIFFDGTDQEVLQSQVRRFIEILFRHPNRTPTVDEYGLFHAKAAAMRSSDLSRQVGAVITTEDGEIIAAGCNEVPKAGGGAFWEGQTLENNPDRRDFTLGHDTNSQMKHELLEEVFLQLKDKGWLSEKHSQLEATDLVDKALFDTRDAPLAGTRATSIVEFGRIVHAEMSAITEAARRGNSVKNATLYCTTFPCHMCARHVISSGIRRVVYVEPYPKSMAKDLYVGLLDVDHDPLADRDAVQFRPFVGVSPRRYIDFFEMPVRKDKRGIATQWAPLNASPRVRQFPTYLETETALVNLLSIGQYDWGLLERDLLTGASSHE